MSQLPAGTLGDAVGVLFFTFICLIANVLLIWLHWTTHDRLGYVALIAYFALICAISSIVQQIYNYTYWDDIMWAQLHYIKANYRNADVAFNNGNFGLMRALANIRLFCYIMESSYLLSYLIQVAFTVRGYWASHRQAERAFAVLGKLVPLVLAGITIGLLQTPAVQRSFTTYMIVAHLQSMTSCTLSILLIATVIINYISARRTWRNINVPSTSRPRPWHFSLRTRPKPSVSSTSSASNQAHKPARPVIFDNSWLVFRLSIAIVLISAFILASVLTHLPQRTDIARDAQATAPDLSASRARSNIIGYIFGVTPGLAIWIVFGLTKAFRKIMYERLVPEGRRSRDRVETATPIQMPHSRGPSATSVGMRGEGGGASESDSEVELGGAGIGTGRVRSDSTDSAEVMTTPLLTLNPWNTPWQGRTDTSRQ
ncbi:hypothetical protein P171DRAFT_279241 [Karstenula rhodostoma CBS 690.94]|uniref:Glycoside hydrolase n=1 Tax=Karstenula rhodostoma CBS 690.94 TaxID=1392251 RepID=A0A9P4PI72_9PLEO|nr:hypothetical protein P171DRAFT_279241 [Karstenula rhodostoma CBS 690.94]